MHLLSRRQCTLCSVGSGSAASPTIATLSGYEYLGCYNDQENRLLNAAVQLDMELSVDKCAYYCSGYISADRFYKYFGVEASGWCFCGDEPTQDLDSVKGGGCSNPCLDASKNQLCGGQWAIQVYSASPGFTPSNVFPRPTSTDASTATSVKMGTAPASTSSSPSSTSKDSSAVIGVSVVAGLLGMALLCIFILWCRRKREKTSQPTLEAPPTFQIKRKPRDAAGTQPTEVQSHPFRAELGDGQVLQLP